jgi:transmembrane sensor
VNDDPRSSSEPTGRRAWRTDQEWARLRARLDAPDLSEPTVAHGGRFRWLGAAGLIVVAVGLTWHFSRPAPTVTRVATTARGERIVIHLADSSVVTLAPASTIRYRFDHSRRDVELDGLAEFTVVHDPKRPFVVRARNAVTTDLGTQFVVRAYATDSSVQVSVTDGSVAMTSPTTPHALELRRGDIGRVASDGTALLVTGTAGAAASRAAWADGRLVFDDESLATVAVELGRWFDVDIHLANQSIATRRVSAVYNNPSLSGLLEALTATLGLRAEQSGQNVRLTQRVP